MNVRIRIEKVVIDTTRSDYNTSPISNNTNKTNLIVFERKQWLKPMYITMHKAPKKRSMIFGRSLNIS